jgi:UDP-N-acetylmuramate--alanine ligase
VSPIADLAATLYSTPKRIHLIGIGGSGLSAIAQVLLEEGYAVSGSDQQASPATESLLARGAQVAIGHRAEAVVGADLVVVSSAIPSGNPEIAEARARHIPVIKRAELLGRMMRDRRGVAVAGTHGKTTTTGMVAQILLEAGQDPTFIVGGVIGSLGTNARAGSGPFVVEADEYDRTFLGLRPWAAVVTNVEHDHPDCYPTFEAMLGAFGEFVDLLPPEGVLVTCCDNPPAKALGEQRAARIEAARRGEPAWSPRKGQPVVMYGLGDNAAWRAVDVQANNAGGSDYVLLHHGQSAGLVRLRVPGLHNVVNSLAALAVADQLGVSFSQASRSLTEFRGMLRRFEIKGEAAGVTVVDDYGHHPTEIKATLAAARARFPGRGIWAVFQPHTYSRAKTLMDDFAKAFADADHVIVTDIYASRERDTLGISSADIVARMNDMRRREVRRDVRHIPGLDQAAAYLLANVKPGDVVITLSAGDGNLVGETLLAGLRQKPGNRKGAGCPWEVPGDEAGHNGRGPG